jgi:cell division protein FtsA
VISYAKHKVSGQEEKLLKHAVVLDIGSSKVVSICAGRVGQDGMAVHGADVRTYSGYRFGAFSDVKDLQRAVLESLEALQRECGFRLREAAIAIPAPFSKLHIGTGSLSFESIPKRITGSDIDMLINKSLPEETPAGCRLIHSTPFSYVLDGATMQELPADAAASRISAMVSHVYVREDFLNPVQEAVKQAGLLPGMCISAPLAQALMLIPEKDRQKPCVLLDVGYTHTDVCVVLQSAIVAQDTLEIGGLHFANDLAYGLEITQSVAELVKRRYVFSLDYQDSVELLRTPQGTRSVDRAHIQYILEERAKELCFMVDDSMRDLGVDVRQSPILCLTGGGLAMMRGSREYLEDMLGLKVRRDMPWMPRMNSPNYASAFGTLEFVLHTGSEDAIPQAEGGVLRRLKELFVK